MIQNVISLLTQIETLSKAIMDEAIQLKKVIAEKPPGGYEEFCDFCDEQQRRLFGKCRVDEINDVIDRLPRSIVKEIDVWFEKHFGRRK